MADVSLISSAFFFLWSCESSCCFLFTFFSVFSFSWNEASPCCSCVCLFECFAWNFIDVTFCVWINPVSWVHQKLLEFCVGFDYNVNLCFIHCPLYALTNVLMYSLCTVGCSVCGFPAYSDFYAAVVFGMKVYGAVWFLSMCELMFPVLSMLFRWSVNCCVQILLFPKCHQRTFSRRWVFMMWVLWLRLSLPDIP